MQFLLVYGPQEEPENKAKHKARVQVQLVVVITSMYNKLTGMCLAKSVPPINKP